ncbi:MAG: DUF4405 domain-containing protein [Bacteroidales bacterium]|nr:DUF4405 domain-containing protein [Bacteroidales bacterium]
MKSFAWRKYISVGLALSFFMIALSGTILYIAPPGRVARWIHWMVLGLNRAQWETQHTLFSYLFLMFGVVHLFSMNWKAFLTFFTYGILNKIRSKKEAIAALTTVLLIFFLTFFEVPPVISIMKLGNNISDTWSEKIGNPPARGVESMSAAEIAELFFDSNVDIVMDLLHEAGFTVNDKAQTITEISVENNTSPMEVFMILQN